MARTRNSSSARTNTSTTGQVQIAPGTGPADGSIGSGSVDTRHPQWEDHIDEWVLMRRTARGTKAIKDAGYDYLPLPQGFTAQRDKGVSMYNDYKKRAQFPEIVSPTLMGMVGVIHRMEAKIDMPDAMMPLWESATDDGLPLEALHRRITFEVITTGRYGLLAEAAKAEDGGSPLPYIVGYTTEDIINWSKDRDFVVLDECELVRTGFSWEPRNQWRVLSLDDSGNYIQTVYSGLSRAQSVENLQPTALGNKPLQEIPFVFIGPKNLLTDVDDAPIIGVAQSAIALYQLSADYRHQLYMSGQETLFVFNMDPPEAIGAGVIVHSKAASKDQQSPDAKYVGPDGTGIEHHKTAIEDERLAAAAAGARLFDTGGASSQESGDARRMRYAAETATLVSIALTSASGLERALRFVALMMGLDPMTVVVTPNLSFIDSKLTPQEITALVAAWQADAFGYETLYENLQRGEVASAERTAEEEQDMITQDHADDINNPATAGLLDPKTGLPVPPAPVKDPVTGQPVVVPPVVPPKKKAPVKKPATENA